MSGVSNPFLALPTNRAAKPGVHRSGYGPPGRTLCQVFIITAFTGQVRPSWFKGVKSGMQLWKPTPSPPHGRPWLFALLGAQQRIHHYPDEF